jgi:NAD(P)-dependent dehydrogenase (short-subunit alcohol dehydrogenase family)
MMAQQSVVMVTGALTGIGRATSSAFARRGDVVVVSGRHHDVGEQLARELKGLGAHDSLFVRADVAFERDVADLVGATVQHFGRVDVAVNNAGTEGRRAPITELTATAYAETFGANVLGTLLSMKRELRVMQGQGSGVIVNLASIHGGKDLPNLAHYAASKQAVIGLTRTAALEAASFGVRVMPLGPNTSTRRYSRRSPVTPTTRPPQLVPFDRAAPGGPRRLPRRSCSLQVTRSRF